MQYTSENLVVRGNSESPNIVDVSPQRAGWSTISFTVKSCDDNNASRINVPAKNEVVIVGLSGTFHVSWRGEDFFAIGSRKNVFSGLPHSLYLPPVMESASIEIIPHQGACEVAVAMAPVPDDFSGKVACTFFSGSH